jgi:hypothetical protein
MAVEDNYMSITAESGGIVRITGDGGEITLSAPWASGRVEVGCAISANGGPISTLTFDDVRELEPGLGFLLHVASRPAAEDLG